MEKMTKTAASYETYAEYVAARRAERFHVLPKTLWTALRASYIEMIEMGEEV